MNRAAGIAVLFIMITISTASNASPPELGKVAWVSGFSAAVEQARKDAKPLFVLFQEIPGCSTCRNYGDHVLSHPLIVDALASEFVAVAIRNNTNGDDDQRVLKSFDEPAWNNPVVRIINADRRELVPRLDGVYRIDGVAAAMADSLRAAKREVPEYLGLLAAETLARRRGTEVATFGMHCFWEGEAKLGRIDGVIQTRPGFVSGSEVVEVEFDPQVVTFEKLATEARTMQCATRIFARTDAQLKAARSIAGDAATRSDEAIRPDNEPKYHLSKSPLRAVPMTESQASRVNAAIATGTQPEKYLSPRQRELARAVTRDGIASVPNQIGRDIRDARPK